MSIDLTRYVVAFTDPAAHRCDLLTTVTDVLVTNRG